MPYTYVINDGKESIGTFYEKELQKRNHKKKRIEKIIRKKETNYISNGKTMTVYLIVGLIKMILYKNESIHF